MTKTVEVSELSFSHDGVIVVAPCIEFVVFLDETDDADLLDFYDRAMRVLGDQLTHYQSESMNGYARITPRAAAMVPTWFSRPRAGKPSYYMTMSSGDPNKAVSPSTLTLSIFRRPLDQISADRRSKWKEATLAGRHFSYPGSMLRISLPLNVPLARPENLVPWMLGSSLLKNGTGFSGHCGYALNHYDQATVPGLYGPATSTLAASVLRHHGLGWDGGAIQSRIMRFDVESARFFPLIKRASWLTFICDRSLSLVGGRTSVRNKLIHIPTLTTHDLDHGIAIQAASAPEIGDLSRLDVLPTYLAIAKVLRPLRIRDIDGVGPGFSDDAANDWLNALDKEYE